jgi:hypothetical protein
MFWLKRKATHTVAKHKATGMGSTILTSLTFRDRDRDRDHGRDRDLDRDRDRFCHVRAL